MKRLIVLALLAVAGCAGPFVPADGSAPLCPAGDTNIYVAQGAKAPCRLRVGQRYVIKMPKSQGTDAALRTVCLEIWGGTSFVVNSGPLDYCVMPKRAA